MKNLALIPPKYFEGKVKKRKIIISGFILGIAIIVFILITLFINNKILNSQQELNLLNKKISSIKEGYTKGTQYEYLTGLCNQRIKTSEQTNIKGIDVLKIIAHLEDNNKNKLTIDNFKITEAGDDVIQVSISGVADSNNNVTQFMNSLENDKLFYSINLNSVNESGEKIQYSMNLNTRK